MAVKRKSSSSTLPAWQKIESGSYIDFEGFAGNEYQSSPPPVLVGVLHGGVFQHFVFTKAYRWAAEYPGVDHPVVFRPDRAAFLKELAESASRSKPLFAYSEHERTIIEYQIGHKIQKRYANVLGISKKWFNKYPELSSKPETNKLVDVARVLGVPMPTKLEEGGVTSRLRRVSDYSRSKKKWLDAPESIRQDWLEVLDHNRSDVLVMFEILTLLRRRIEEG